MTLRVKTHLRTRVAPGFILGLAAAALVFSGCALPNRLKHVESGAPTSEHVQILYRVRNTHGNMPQREVQQAGLEDPLANPTTDSGGHWKSARLKIEYPHPEAGAEMARATLVLSQVELPEHEQPTIGKRIAERFNRLTSHACEEPCCSSNICATSSGPDDEIWVLDFPKQQLDLLLNELGNSGFFENQTRPSGGADLDVAIGRDRTQKPWSTEPRFDELVTRVFREGMLEGFVTAELRHDCSDHSLPQ